MLLLSGFLQGNGQVLHTVFANSFGEVIWRQENGIPEGLKANKLRRCDQQTAI